MITFGTMLMLPLRKTTDHQRLESRARPEGLFLQATPIANCKQSHDFIPSRANKREAEPIIWPVHRPTPSSTLRRSRSMTTVARTRADSVIELPDRCKPENHLLKVWMGHSLLPPLMLKACQSGKYVVIQKLLANPGHEAAFRPYFPIYQFEQSPANTEAARPW